MKGVVVWITGRPSAGKSTLAAAVAALLQRAQIPTAVLDGDAVRAALVPSPGYDPQSRKDWYESLAGLAALLARQGLVVLVPATAHLRAYRERARALAPRYLEVYVNTREDECRARDSKGLYALAASRQVTNLPSADSAYEPPLAPDLEVEGGKGHEAAQRVVALIQENAHNLREA